ncbi:hypothetical protein [Chlamydia abortus]|uniref:Uncharacterized protein n=1 Tax=Chlamydia abortus (strain DSM 27085 / S26/3) TaxID=218497 RepID=Q5L775_CHLAB|nr:hypothetical protein [Chlamydia abortus]ASD30227.1 hypothetical protein CEF07_00190 [Chlamydia abortus]AUS59457.1 uncharacterized protein CHAB577_0036 [Chlamydia abortus]QRR31752.1 hypothetical protein JS522_00180 [Chlamydia abortus]CAH63493.1 conserved hypothetical protein [Chlamydia abortus S26/3]CED80098.1 conserved hypothetical protein [Chlamydia abortus]
MIDPLKLFPKLDSEKETASIQKPLGTPLASELHKEVPAFSLGTAADSLNKNIEDVKPNPMAMMQDRNSNIIDPELEEALDSEELKEQINNLKERLWDAQSTLQQDQNKLSQEHFEAVSVIIDLINGDLNDIAEHTQQNLQTKKEEEHESVARKMVNWVSSGEEVLNRALLYFSDRNGERENLADFLKVQYAVQRATQRAELFASIVGTTVSSIKTIMTTQLG